MTFTPHGKHLVAGEWIATDCRFQNEPAHGAAYGFSVGTVDLVNRACAAAEDASWTYGSSAPDTRAAFFEAIGTAETGLPEARLNGERGRTTSQLRLFADHIRKGDYLDRRHDAAMPERQPMPRPEIRMIQRPIGPIAVFGASNFPLAFSTAGGDTAAALAAGCPVVVKVHSAHPGTAEIVAEAVHAAIRSCGILPGVFSLTMGAGQFCTNPGIAVVVRGEDADRFVAATHEALAQVGPQVMLTQDIATAYHRGNARLAARNSVTAVLPTDSQGRAARPNLYATSGDAFLQDNALGEEVFGPLGLVVRVRDTNAMADLAKGFAGQLTATIHMDDPDTEDARRLVPILERKAGRVLVNGFPTGVEVVDSMVHGGPYPASTNFDATSVGTLSIRRFLRPVSFQNVPAALLPAELRA